MLAGITDSLEVLMNRQRTPENRLFSGRDELSGVDKLMGWGFLTSHFGHLKGKIIMGYF